MNASFVQDFAFYHTEQRGLLFDCLLRPLYQLWTAGLQL